jgi:hypothetical protein
VTEENSKELASRISFEIVKDIAPRELPLFDDYKEKFMKNPDAFAEKDSKKREKMLGFGVLDGVSQLLTAIVLPISFNAIKKYATKKKGKELDNDQLINLRKEAYDNAITMGMNKAKAELMADALVGKMVTMSGAR